MKLHKTKVDFETVKVIENKEFTNDSYDNVINFLNGKNSESAGYHFVLDDNPKHQQLCSIFLAYDGHHDIFISRTVLLPSIGEEAPKEYEVKDEIIWEWTNEPEEFFKMFIGKSYVESVESDRIYSNGFSAKDHLIERLSVLYGYSNMDEIRVVVNENIRWSDNNEQK